MATSFCLRTAATTFLSGLLALGALAAEVANGRSDGKDKSKIDSASRTTSERSTTRDSSGPGSSGKGQSPSRDSSSGRGAPAYGGGQNSPMNSAPAGNGAASQSRSYRGPDARPDNWRGRSDHDPRDRDTWDRDPYDRGYRDDWGVNPYNAGPYANRYFTGAGIVVGANARGLQVSANGAIWHVLPDRNAVIEVNGTAGPDFLTPGRIVKFQAALDPINGVKDKAITPVTALEVISEHPGEMIGAAPAGADAKQDPALPATARTLTVIGKITSHKQNVITVFAGNSTIKADLDITPEIKVRVADYSIARKGDQIEVTGYYTGPRNAIANRISITLASPLGNPLSQFNKQKPAKQITNPAGGQK